MPKLLNALAKVSELCKRRGFVIERCAKNVAGHGVDNLLDYGPLGVEMKRNVGNEWWHEIVTSRDNIYGVDLSMVDLAQTNFTRGIIGPEHLNISYLCEICRHASDHMESYGFKMPFGLVQHVRMFTRENKDIDQFIFRSHQKELLKLCFFCPPNKLNFWMDYWVRKRLSWWKKYADMPAGFALSDSASTRLFCQENNSSFTDTVAVEYNFPWGNEAIECISSYSNVQELIKTGNANTERLGVVVATASTEKGILAYLLDALHEKEQMNSHAITASARHNTLRLHPALAPVKVAVLCNTLSNDLYPVAQQLATELRQAGIASSYVEFEDYNECYSKQDEVGTPYYVTVQDSTLTNGIVTLRNRDTTISEFLHISEILKTVQRHLDL